MIKSEEAGKLHIAIVGRKNVGKSLLINRVISQELFIVNDTPGTTTDPVSKAVELMPYGPVVIIDTAGIDNEDEAGKKKLSKTIRAISNADFAVVVLDAREELDKSETGLITLLRKIQVPFLVAVNKIEFGINPYLLAELEALEVTHFEISCKENAGIESFKKKLIHLLPGEKEMPVLNGLVEKGNLVVLVVPDDFNRKNEGVIELQAHTIREELNKDIGSIIVKEKDFVNELNKLKNLPDLVIADNDAIRLISSYLPQTIKLTTYSLVMAGHKGDLLEFVDGINRIKKLENGDKVLFSEGCSEHIRRYGSGRARISEELQFCTKKILQIDFSNGGVFPDNLPDYKLIIHCDGCAISRKLMHSRINQAKLLDIPIVNYGVLVSFMNGNLSRVITPFSEAVSTMGKLKYV
jgi:[FeFe] hydrogenase H-cluster maturation GTPase HydF